MIPSRNVRTWIAHGGERMFLSSAYIPFNSASGWGEPAVFEVVCTDPKDAQFIHSQAWRFNIEVLAGECGRPDLSRGQTVIARFSKCRIAKTWITGLVYHQDEVPVEYHFRINSEFYIPLEVL